MNETIYFHLFHVVQNGNEKRKEEREKLLQMETLVLGLAEWDRIEVEWNTKFVWL